MMLRSIIRLLAIIALFIQEMTLQAVEETCETLQSEIHITKDEFDERGRLIRTCNRNVFVNKCDGACDSQVRPSVETRTGFSKECSCCRETFLKERTITLNECYAPDGIPLTSEKLSQMEIKLREPVSCKCYKCGNLPI